MRPFTALASKWILCWESKALNFGELFMGQFKQLLKRVELKQETTVLILNHYIQALYQAGLLTKESPKDSEHYKVVEGTHFDSRLLPTDPKTNAGVLNQAMRRIELFAKNAYGAQSINLQPMEYEVDDNLAQLYKKYVQKWTALLVGNGFKEEQIIAEHLTNPHLLVSHLLKRLMAFILSDANLPQINHEQYFKALELFIEGLVKDSKSPFKKGQEYDFMGFYLLKEHKHFISSFKNILHCRKKLESHKMSVNEANHLISKTEKIIQCQIAAFWEPKITKAKLADECLGNTLLTIEKATSALVRSSKKESPEILLEQQYN
jgi:hypothetical protein